jgi:predicted transcriptional regulator of viral defense system
MNFTNLIDRIGGAPVFETNLLLAGEVDPFEVHKQLSRWVAAGKIYQLRRGLYTLAPPYQKVNPHPFLIANHIQHGSYISLQSALAFYNLIPERVPMTTSVTTGRPLLQNTPLGEYQFRHIRLEWFQAYSKIDLGSGQTACVATPEKALLDLIYLETHSDAPAYLKELRLQNMKRLDLEQMLLLVRNSHKPKLIRAYEEICRLSREEFSGYETL